MKKRLLDQIRRWNAAKATACPKCYAQPGQCCETREGYWMQARHHAERWRAAAQIVLDTHPLPALSSTTEE